MYARVVRFTDIKPDQIDRIKSQSADEGPPPDVPAKSMRMIVDESQGTAVALVLFESEEDMRKADAALNAMDSSDTPGTRASVDQGEVVIDVDT